ncbi:MAG: hypothetical protein V3W44_00450 [Dehalococcoidales bacterium]
MMQQPAKDKRYKSSIPKEAKEEVRSRYPDGTPKCTVYLLDGKEVGTRY